MDIDDKICYCFHVSKRKVLNFIRIHRPSHASRVSECGGAGTGCGWCVPFLKKYFELAQEDRLGESDSLTAGEYARGRGEYLRDGHGVPPPGATPPPPIASPDDEESAGDNDSH